MSADLAVAQPAPLEEIPAGELTAAYLHAIVEVPFGETVVRGSLKSVEHDAAWGRLCVKLSIRSEHGGIYPQLPLGTRVRIIDTSEAVGRRG